MAVYIGGRRITKRNRGRAKRSVTNHYNNEAIDIELKDLFDMLSFRRSGWTQGEYDFIRAYIHPIPGIARDEYGNYFVRIGDAPVLWSCHLDTVHSPEESNGTRQGLSIDDEGIVSARESSCLGADNTAGIFILLRMIKAGRPGLYIFHRDEESGGHGSKHLAKETPGLIEGIKWAVAFDRKKTTSVITHQGYRTCSDAFGRSFIDELQRVTNDEIKLKLDDGGLFTDTASYADLIPECTNISAGFSDEHHWYETLDTKYLKKLMRGMLKFDTKNLVTERDPADPVEWSSDWGNFMQGSNELWEGRPYYEYLISSQPKLVMTILKTYGILDEVMADMEQSLM